MRVCRAWFEYVRAEHSQWTHIDLRGAFKNPLEIPKTWVTGGPITGIGMRARMASATSVNLRVGKRSHAAVVQFLDNFESLPKLRCLRLNLHWRYDCYLPNVLGARLVRLDLTDSRLSGKLLIKILKASHMSMKSLVLDNADIASPETWTMATPLRKKIRDLQPLVDGITDAILECEALETLSFYGVDANNHYGHGLSCVVDRLLYNLDDFPGPVMLNLRELDIRCHASWLIAYAFDSDSCQERGIVDQSIAAVKSFQENRLGFGTQGVRPFKLSIWSEIIKKTTLTLNDTEDVWPGGDIVVTTMPIFMRLSMPRR